MRKFRFARFFFINAFNALQKDVNQVKHEIQKSDGLFELRHGLKSQGVKNKMRCSTGQNTPLCFKFQIQVTGNAKTCQLPVTQSTVKAEANEISGSYRSNDDLMMALDKNLLE